MESMGMDWDAVLTVVWTLIKILVLVVPLMLGVAYLTYAERKIIGWMQVRIGPNRVGFQGLLQPIADAVKLLMKEIIIPSGANKGLFILGPILAIAPALAAWAVIPFADGLVLADINAGLLYVMAITSMGVYGVIIAGWASNSKYAFLGAMRSAAQIVSYEIAMGFALVGVLMAAQSLNLTDIVQGQSGGVHQWYVQSRSVFGAGAWGGPSSFSVPPAAVTTFDVLASLLIRRPFRSSILLTGVFV